MKAALLLIALSPLSVAAETWKLDASTGSFKVLLEKDGPLRALGHDHVVRAPVFAGTVELSSASASLSLTIDAGKLTIDEDADRASEGWKTLDAGDKAKIAASMRGDKGLDVEKHAKIELKSDSIEPVEGEKDLWRVEGKLSLHGQTRAVDFPVTMLERADGRWFSGYVRLRPSEYGIKPFSVFGGAVRVKDEAVVKFSLRANK